MTDYGTSLRTAMTRIKAMELLAVTDSKASENYHTFVYSTAPYWVNSLLSTTVSITNPSRQTYTASIAMSYRSVPLQAGLIGEYEESLMYTHIPATLAYFTLYPALNYTSGQAQIAGLQPDLTRIVSNGTLVSGDENLTLEAQFVLTLSFQFSVSQVFRQP